MVDDMSDERNTTGSAPLPGHAGMTMASLVEGGALFRYCPSCASPRLVSDRGRRWNCPDCGFEYFHNVATAAGIIVEARGRLLFLERAKDPERGKLALPGGFVEPGERAEDAALRECREETGWAPDHIEFLSSYPNLYRYKGMPYATCDLFFRSRSASLALADLDPDRDESAAIRFIAPEDLPWERIAFESTRRAIRSWFRWRAGGMVSA
jgi:NAD+ diphosphatase